MLSSILWSQYISVIIVSLIAYYFYVGYKYFRWELLALIGIKKIEAGGTPIAIADLKREFTGSNHDDYLPRENVNIALQPFLDELSACVNEINPSESGDDIIAAVQNITAKYPIIKNDENKLLASDSIIRLLQHHFPGKFLSEDIQDVIR